MTGKRPQRRGSETESGIKRRLLPLKYSLSVEGVKRCSAVTAIEALGQLKACELMCGWSTSSR